MKPDFGIHSHNVILADKDFPTDCTLLIKDGIIIDIVPSVPRAGNIPSLSSHCDSYIMPGIIDPHVHINEPGTDWEGFETASNAALAGGTTTLVDMPLNSIPVTTTVAALEQKIAAAEGKTKVNCHFWGGVIPGNLDQIEPLIERGVLGFKAFLAPSGLNEFPNIEEEDLRKAMKIIAKYDIPLLVHCEIEYSNGDDQFFHSHYPYSYQRFLKSRPYWWERESIRLLIKLCAETGCRTHIVHLSAAESLPLIIEAKENGLPLTVETCPHYLYFNSEQIPFGQVAYKCTPPIRKQANREKLWQAIKDGHIDFIASDHSPAPPAIKEPEPGNLYKAWGGIAGLQFTLPVLWTEARERGISISRLSKLLSTNAAHFLGLGDKKGKLAVGYDADLVVWDPDSTIQIKKEMIQHRHKMTPYLGKELYGEVRYTYLKGKDKLREVLRTEEGD